MDDDKIDDKLWVHFVFYSLGQISGKLVYVLCDVQ